MVPGALFFSLINLKTMKGMPYEITKMFLAHHTTRISQISRIQLLCLAIPHLYHCCRTIHRGRCTATRYRRCWIYHFSKSNPNFPFWHGESSERYIQIDSNERC